MQFEIPDGAAREALIERAADADLALALRLERPRAERAADTRPTYGEIHRAAALGDPSARARVADAARRDLWVARTYREILARDAHALFGELRAASTGEVAVRRAGGYAVEVRSSAKRPERAFLVVACDPGAPAPTRLVVHPDTVLPDGAEIALGDAADGVIQVVLASDHPVVAAVRDPERSFHLA